MRRIAFSMLLLLLLGAQARADEAEQIERLRQTIAKQNAAQQEKLDQELQKLQTEVDSSDPQTRAQAITKILHHRDARLIPVIRALLTDPNAFTRREAIMALSRLQAKDAAADVGKLLSDPDPSVQYAAAECGAQLGYKSTPEEVKRFLKSKDLASQSAAMHLSQTLPPEQAVPMLATFLTHESPYLRGGAVTALWKYDDKQIRPYAASILRLAGDSDVWVRQAVLQQEQKLQPLVTTDELRKLSQNGAPEARALALRMLDERGENVSDEIAANLHAVDPALRKAALESFMLKGKGPEKEIVALLDDPDRGVKSVALYAVERLKFTSAVPKLQAIFAAGDRQDRRSAAAALLKMDEPLWPKQEPPQARGPLFEAAAKAAGGDEHSLTKLRNETGQLMDEIAQLKQFPCDRSKMMNPKGNLAFTRRGPDDDHNLSRIIDSAVVVHGNLAVNGYVKGGLIIVTGDLYAHDGYIFDSIVLVQGSIVSDGYIRNSIVVAGSTKKLALSHGYVWGSVVAAGAIECDGYYKDSLLGAKLDSSSSGRLDLRDSSRFDSKPIYDRLHGASGKQEGKR